MPLKVSSQGWVKVAPPPKPRRRPVDPEEQREAFCSPLRYFACQAVDPTRERLRMLGGRAGFSSSQVDLLRPHSRLERTSTLDEWRFDVPPSRSTSRQSGIIDDTPLSPPRDNMESRSSSRSQRHDNGHGDNDPARSSERRSGSSQGRSRNRVASAPIIISASPSPSVYGEQDTNDANVHPDNASVAFSETPSERNCRHNHRHGKPRKPPTVIPEEEEPDSATIFNELPMSNPPPSIAGSEICSLRDFRDEIASTMSSPAPPPSIARSESSRSRITAIDIPNPVLQSIPESTTVSESIPEPILEHKPDPPRSEVSSRSEESERSKRSERSEYSSRSSRTSKSSRSSAYRSRDTESEADTESSYTASTRSASPIRERERDRYRERDYKPRPKPKQDRYYEDDETESYYPSPPPSPKPSRSRLTREEAPPPKSYRDRSVTAPVTTSRYAPQSASSQSSWTSSSLSSSSRSSGTGSTRSSAPSIDGYQFQAAIFQPKSYYKGYRAPSLSKGNRWETATSALSFD